MIKGKANYLHRLTSRLPMMPTVATDHIEGSSPPSVFIGRYGYPRVAVGPLVPAFHGDTVDMDTPERWIGKSVNDIVKFRLQLIRGKTTVRVDEKNRTVEQLHDLALAKRPTDVDATFKSVPRGGFFNEEVQPFGPSGTLKTLDLAASHYDKRLSKAFYDTDLRARDAVTTLYENNVLFSSIQKAFSVGAFGIEDNRKLVPTRWSITAVDDTLGHHLIEEIKNYSTIEDYQVYEFGTMNTYFSILLMPTSWNYEFLEAFMRIFGREELIFSDWEPYGERKTYASMGGCYYSTKLAVAEKLHDMQRQAGVLVFRESYTGYVPLGVWLVRQTVRKAMQQQPMHFESKSAALTYIATKLRLPFSRYQQQSVLLKQKRVDDFASSRVA